MKRVCFITLVMVGMLAIAGTVFAAGAEETGGSMASADGPQYGGSIKFFDYFGARDMATWDINADNAWTVMKLGGVVYERLLAVNYAKGRTGSGDFEYTGRLQAIEHMDGGDGLAQSYEFVDPTTLVFKLKEGIMWPAKPGIMDTSRELTADDIAFAYNTALESPKVGQQLKGPLEGAVATDKYTVQLNLRYFWGDWLYDLVLNKRLIYSPESYEAGLNDWKNAHGNGAFQVVEYIQGSAIYCERNPNYFVDDYVIDGKEYQLPFADEFVHVIMPDPASQIAALRTGTIDVHVRVFQDFYETLANSSPDLNHFAYNNYGGYQVGMRMDQDPFTDIKVRKAMAMAINRQEMIDELMAGEAEILNAPIPRAWGEAVWTPVDELPADVAENLSYNPEKARQLLTEAGFPNGFSTKVLIENAPSEIDLLSLCADYWAQIGVEVTLDVVDPTTFTARRTGGEYQGLCGRTDTSPTYKGAFDAFWVQEGDEVQNSAKLNDAKLNSMIDAATKELDPVRASQMFKEANVYALALSSYVILPQAGYRAYAWPWIKNYDGEQMITYHSGARAMQYAWVDQELKKSMGFK